MARSADVAPRHRYQPRFGSGRPVAVVRMCPLYRSEYASSMSLLLPRARACRSAPNIASMCVHVCVEQATEHPLVLRVPFRSSGLEDLDALLAKPDGDLHVFIAERQLLRRRKKIANNSWITNR